MDLVGKLSPPDWSSDKREEQKSSDPARQNESKAFKPFLFPSILVKTVLFPAGSERIGQISKNIVSPRIDRFRVKLSSLYQRIVWLNIMGV
jgi:hypothetical protein